MGHGSRVTCQPHRKVIDRSNDRYLTHKCGQWQSRVQLFSFLNCFLGEEGKKIKETRNLQILFCKDKLCVSCCIYIYISINFSKKQEETINRRERERKKKEKKKLDEMVKAISKARKEWFIDEGLAMYRVKSAPLMCLSGCKWLSSWRVNEERQFTVIKRLWYDSRVKV